jgi:hypothetical protein
VDGGGTTRGRRSSTSSFITRGRTPDPSIVHDRGNLRRSNSPVCRRRENRLTRISLAIVWLFLFCHIWKIIPSAYEMTIGRPLREGPEWLEYIQQVSHALILLNSSVNFLIYVML